MHKGVKHKAKLRKGPAIKKFMPLVVIIGGHDVLKNFWIL